MKKKFLVTLLFFGFMIAAAMLYKPSRKTDTADSSTEQEVIQEIVVLTPFSTYKASIVKTEKMDAEKGTPGELLKHKKYSKIETMPGVNESGGT